MIKSARVRVLLIILIGLSLTVTAIWVLQRRFGYSASQANLLTPQVQASPSSSISVATPQSLPPDSPPLESIPDDNFEQAAPSDVAPSPTPALTLEPSYVGRLNLAVPVLGVKPDQLLDTFKDARSEGRVHDAIDIPAPAGTPVIAVVEGEIIKLFESEKGGTTIYQSSKDKKLIFYYAHLQRYADGLVVGKTVWQGETIAYVGDTGNAGAGNYHLHFSIMVTNNPKRYWEGTNINPYPLLRKR
jgi:peptidoglycan LD-endopeptidase LytH